MFSTDGVLGKKFGIITSAMDGLAMRQQVHAENLSNVDTAGYKARTVEFEGVLQNAMRAGTVGSSSLLTSTGRGPSGPQDASIAGTLTSQFAARTRAGSPGVNRTTEVAAMMNDNIRFRVLSQQVTNKLSELKQVIAEMGRG